jgi:predicted RNA-binding Zn ribbon-like protein
VATVDIDAVPLLGADTTPHAVGSRLCLAAVNSVLWRRGPQPQERLHTYSDLVTLVAGAGWVPDPAALRRKATRHRARAEHEVAAARDLREQLYVTFSAVAARSAPADAALRAVEDLATQGLARLRLAPDRSGYRLQWPAIELDLPVRLIAVSALVLLASPELDRVKQCPGPTCGWVFLDSTRNHSRRWCDSTECGNRNRVQAHYQRNKATAH